MNSSPDKTKSRRGGARPNSGPKPYEPTETDRTIVMVMTAAGISQDRIGACIADGISDATLRKYFARELEIGRDKINGLCAQGIVKAMQAGEAWALCFWAKTRMGWRETNRQEIVGANGGPVEFANRESLSDRIAGIASRIGALEDNFGTDR